MKTPTAAVLPLRLSEQRKISVQCLRIFPDRNYILTVIAEVPSHFIRQKSMIGTVDNLEEIGYADSRESCSPSRDILCGRALCRPILFIYVLREPTAHNICHVGCLRRVPMAAPLFPEANHKKVSLAEFSLDFRPCPVQFYC